jgi:ribosomal-protein-alanine N-acetyltransferase
LEKMKLLFGDHLIRNWCKADAVPLQRYADNRKIWLNLRDIFPHPYTLEDARWWVANASQEDPECSFAIATVNEPIGGIGLVLGEDVNRYNAELGYWLAEPFWGRGITTDGVRTFTEWAFEHFSLNRIFATPFAGNYASERVLEKARFTREGVLTNAIVKDGVIRDQVMYAKIRAKGPSGMVGDTGLEPRAATGACKEQVLNSASM